jgi:hypothetical protein
LDVGEIEAVAKDVASVTLWLVVKFVPATAILVPPYKPKDIKI